MKYTSEWCRLPGCNTKQQLTYLLALRSWESEHSLQSPEPSAVQLLKNSKCSAELQMENATGMERPHTQQAKCSPRNLHKSPLSFLAKPISGNGAAGGWQHCCACTWEGAGGTMGLWDTRTSRQSLERQWSLRKQEGRKQRSWRLQGVKKTHAY